jgi:peptide/nickel transport system substrate-binding protein
VVFTYELVRVPEVASPYIDSWEHLDSVVAVDERRVTFHFKRRYPGMLFHTGIGIVPAHVFESVAAENAALAGHPSLVEPDERLVVSGPYAVLSWNRGERLVLGPNPRAFTARPQTDTLVFRIIPEETTRLVELENGGLDVAGPLPMDRAAQLDADPRFRVETVDDRLFDFIAWNGERFPPFRDPEVRLALSLAIDRAGILAGLGISDYSEPAAGPYPRVFSALTDPELNAHPYRPDSASAILASKGWVDGDGDGVLERDGIPFRFVLRTQAGNQRRASAAEIIQARFAGIGVDVRIELLEFNALLGMVFEEHDFEAVLLGWQVGLEPDWLLGHFWPPDHFFNITGYTSTVLDSLFPLAKQAETTQGAAPIWRAVARVIAEDQPYAFLWFYDDAVVVNERVRGTRIDTYGIYQNLHQWRVEN